MNSKPKVTRLTGKSSKPNKGAPNSLSESKQSLPASKYLSWLALVVLGIAVFYAGLAIGNRSSVSPNYAQKTDKPIAEKTEVNSPGDNAVPSPRTRTGAWYEGGTLYDANALEWQKATYENKLATCAKVIFSLSSDGQLKPEIAARITSIEETRQLAEILVEDVDNATIRHPDPATNQRIYATREVSEIIARIIIFDRKWTD